MQRSITVFYRNTRSVLYSKDKKRTSVFADYKAIKGRYLIVTDSEYTVNVCFYSCLIGVSAKTVLGWAAQKYLCTYTWNVHYSRSFHAIMSVLYHSLSDFNRSTFWEGPLFYFFRSLLQAQGDKWSLKPLTTNNVISDTHTHARTHTYSLWSF